MSIAPVAAAIGLLAVAGVTLLHVIGRRSIRPRMLPTARFVPSSAVPLIRRWWRPTDLRLFIARVAATVCAALALALTAPLPRREAQARVLVVDASRAVASMEELADSVRALSDGVSATRIVRFDTTARLVAMDEAGRAPIVDAPGDLAAGLIRAVQEVETLRRRFTRVDVAVVSPLAREEWSAAVPVVARLIEAPVRFSRPALASEASEGTGALVLPEAAHPVGAATRSALDGRPAPRLHVVVGLPSAADSVFARAGGVVVAWPRATADDSTPVRALRTRSGVAIGRWGRGPVPPGEVVARWEDGEPAGTQATHGSGCLRTVGVELPARGDDVLRPALAGVVRDLLRPCRTPQLDPVTGAEVASLAGGGPRSKAPTLPDPLLRRALVALALLALLAEWRLRRSGPGKGSA